VPVSEPPLGLRADEHHPAVGIQVALLRRPAAREPN